MSEIDRVWVDEYEREELKQLLERKDAAIAELTEKYSALVEKYSACADKSVAIAENAIWKQAVMEQCIIAHINFYPDDPKKTLHELLNWHVTVALDPLVSSSAQALIDRGRSDRQIQSAPSGMEG